MDKEDMQNEQLTPVENQEECVAVDNNQEIDNNQKAVENKIIIKDEEVWTYRIPGLAAPRIGKPIKHKLLKQIVLVAIIIVAVALAIYFSVSAVQKDTFEFKDIESGMVLSKFSNTGYIKELSVDYYTEIDYKDGDSNPETNFFFVKNEEKPITEIAEYAFNCDEKLQTIYVGASVEKINGKSFYSCTALERIEVDENNKYFCDVDGVLFNKELTEVICYPIKHSTYVARTKGYLESADTNDAKYVEDVLTYRLPQTITKIGQLSFNYTDLVNVYIPEGIKNIDNMAFFRATNLKEIYAYKANGDTYKSIPEGVEYIGADAFSYCQSLSYVYIPSSVVKIGHHAFWDTIYKEDGDLKGVVAINIARSEKDFKKNVDCGDQWRPKYDFLLFKKNVPTYYDASRLQ